MCRIRTVQGLFKEISQECSFNSSIGPRYHISPKPLILRTSPSSSLSQHFAFLRLITQSLPWYTYGNITITLSLQRSLFNTVIFVIDCTLILLLYHYFLSLKCCATEEITTHGSVLHYYCLLLGF